MNRRAKARQALVRTGAEMIVAFRSAKVALFGGTKGDHATVVDSAVLTGLCVGAIDPYLLRSVMCPHFTACFDVRRTDLDYEMIRRVMGQWREFAEYFYGDYYPLTSYSLEKDVWIGWQFHTPEKDAGMIQAYRRSESVYESARFKLRGLEPESKYVVQDLDQVESEEVTGRALMEDGLKVVIEEQPGSVVISYRKVQP